eukprot:8738747-Lingulodinium_polyedra.AAC.1
MEGGQDLYAAGAVADGALPKALVHSPLHLRPQEIEPRLHVSVGSPHCLLDVLSDTFLHRDV